MELAEVQTGQIFYRFFCCEKLICEYLELNFELNFNYVFINLSNVKVPFFKKMKTFLVKAFYLNFVKKAKCILIGTKKEMINSSELEKDRRDLK